VNLPLVGTIYSQSNEFVMGVKIRATGNSKFMTALAWKMTRMTKMTEQ